MNINKVLLVVLIVILSVPIFSESKDKGNSSNTVTILYDDFEITALQDFEGTPEFADDEFNNAPSTWATSGVSGGACIGIGPLRGFPHDCTEFDGLAELTPNLINGTATLFSLRKASLSEGTLVFKTLLSTSNRLNPASLASGSAWGLVSGDDRTNAIEFVKTSSNEIACRTVSAGKVTETVVGLDQDLSEPANYQITATSKVVYFYVNRSLLATHKTNIPLVDVNPYFHLASGSPKSGVDEIRVSFVSFELLPKKK